MAGPGIFMGGSCDPCCDLQGCVSQDYRLRDNVMAPLATKTFLHLEHTDSETGNVSITEEVYSDYLEFMHWSRVGTAGDESDENSLYDRSIVAAVYPTNNTPFDLQPEYELFARLGYMTSYAKRGTKSEKIHEKNGVQFPWLGSQKHDGTYIQAGIEYAASLPENFTDAEERLQSVQMSKVFANATYGTYVSDDLKRSGVGFHASRQPYTIIYFKIDPQDDYTACFTSDYSKLMIAHSKRWWRDPNSEEKSGAGFSWEVDNNSDPRLTHGFESQGNKTDQGYPPYPQHTRFLTSSDAFRFKHPFSDHVRFFNHIGGYYGFAEAWGPNFVTDDERTMTFPWQAFPALKGDEIRIDFGIDAEQNAFGLTFSVFHRSEYTATDGEYQYRENQSFGAKFYSDTIGNNNFGFDPNQELATYEQNGVTYTYSPKTKRDANPAPVCASFLPIRNDCLGIEATNQGVSSETLKNRVVRSNGYRQFAFFDEEYKFISEVIVRGLIKEAGVRPIFMPAKKQHYSINTESEPSSFTVTLYRFNNTAFEYYDAIYDPVTRIYSYERKYHETLLGDPQHKIWEDGEHVGTFDYTLPDGPSQSSSQAIGAYVMRFGFLGLVQDGDVSFRYDDLVLSRIVPDNSFSSDFETTASGHASSELYILEGESDSIDIVRRGTKGDKTVHYHDSETGWHSLFFADGTAIRSVEVEMESASLPPENYDKDLFIPSNFNAIPLKFKVRPNAIELHTEQTESAHSSAEPRMASIDLYMMDFDGWGRSHPTLANYGNNASLGTGVISHNLVDRLGYIQINGYKYDTLHYNSQCSGVGNSDCLPDQTTDFYPHTLIPLDVDVSGFTGQLQPHSYSVYYANDMQQPVTRYINNLDKADLQLAEGYLCYDRLVAEYEFKVYTYYGIAPYSSENEGYGCDGDSTYSINVSHYGDAPSDAFIPENWDQFSLTFTTSGSCSGYETLESAFAYLRSPNATPRFPSQYNTPSIPFGTLVVESGSVESHGVATEGGSVTIPQVHGSIADVTLLKWDSATIDSTEFQIYADYDDNHYSQSGLVLGLYLEHVHGGTYHGNDKSIWEHLYGTRLRLGHQIYVRKTHDFPEARDYDWYNDHDMYGSHLILRIMPRDAMPPYSYQNPTAHYYYEMRAIAQTEIFEDWMYDPWGDQYDEWSHQIDIVEDILKNTYYADPENELFYYVRQLQMGLRKTFDAEWTYWHTHEETEDTSWEDYDFSLDERFSFPRGDYDVPRFATASSGEFTSTNYNYNPPQTTAEEGVGRFPVDGDGQSSFTFRSPANFARLAFTVYATSNAYVSVWNATADPNGHSYDPDFLQSFLVSDVPRGQSWSLDRVEKNDLIVVIFKTYGEKSGDNDSGYAALGSMRGVHPENMFFTIGGHKGMTEEWEEDQEEEFLYAWENRSHKHVPEVGYECDLEVKFPVSQAQMFWPDAIFFEGLTADDPIQSDPTGNTGHPPPTLGSGLFAVDVNRPNFDYCPDFKNSAFKDINSGTRYLNQSFANCTDYPSYDTSGPLLDCNVSVPELPNTYTFAFPDHPTLQLFVSPSEQNAFAITTLAAASPSHRLTPDGKSSQAGSIHFYDCCGNDGDTSEVNAGAYDGVYIAMSETTEKVGPEDTFEANQDYRTATLCRSYDTIRISDVLDIEIASHTLKFPVKWSDCWDDVTSNSGVVLTPTQDVISDAASTMRSTGPSITSGYQPFFACSSGSVEATGMIDLAYNPSIKGTYAYEYFDLTPDQLVVTIQTLVFPNRPKS